MARGARTERGPAEQPPPSQLLSLNIARQKTKEPGRRRFISCPYGGAHPLRGRRASSRTPPWRTNHVPTLLDNSSIPLLKFSISTLRKHFRKVTCHETWRGSGVSQDTILGPLPCKDDLYELLTRNITTT